MKKKYKTFIDETAQLFDKIFVSAGARGIQVSISPKNLISTVEGIFAELI
jgi:Cys-tRNA(Pro)/Cys-tRNA(Cys) deacylase